MTGGKRRVWTGDRPEPVRIAEISSVRNEITTVKHLASTGALVWQRDHKLAKTSTGARQCTGLGVDVNDKVWGVATDASLQVRRWTNAGLVDASYSSPSSWSEGLVACAAGYADGGAVVCSGEQSAVNIWRLDSAGATSWSDTIVGIPLDLDVDPDNDYTYAAQYIGAGFQPVVWEYDENGNLIRTAGSGWTCTEYPGTYFIWGGTNNGGGWLKFSAGAKSGGGVGANFLGTTAGMFTCRTASVNADWAIVAGGGHLCGYHWSSVGGSWVGAFQVDDNFTHARIDSSDTIYALRTDGELRSLDAYKLVSANYNVSGVGNTTFDVTTQNWSTQSVVALGTNTYGSDDGQIRLDSSGDIIITGRPRKRL